MKKQPNIEVKVATIFLGATREAQKDLGTVWECWVDTVRFDHHYGLVIDNELIYSHSSQLPIRGSLSIHYQDYTNATLVTRYGKPRSLIMDSFKQGKESNVVLYDQDCRTQAEIIARNMRNKGVETFVIEEAGRLDKVRDSLIHLETDRMNYTHSYEFTESLKAKGMTEINVLSDGTVFREGKIIKSKYKISNLNLGDNE